MFNELAKASLLIFLAELGDKTQILAMAFALQYSVGQVLLGVALGSFFNHGLAAVSYTHLNRASPSWEMALAKTAAKGTKPLVKRVTKMICGPQPGIIPMSTPTRTAKRPVWDLSLIHI